MPEDRRDPSSPFEIREARLRHTRRQVELVLRRLEEFFKPECRFTFLSRLPGNDESDFLITSDDLDEVLKAIDRSRKRTMS